jgi:hypothetical protein
MERSVRRLVAGTLVTGALVVGTGTTPALAQAGQPKAQTQQPKAQKLTADDIVRRAIADLKSASSVRVYGRLSELGLVLVTRATYTEQGCLSYISVSAQGQGYSISVLDVGGSVWFQPSNNIWQELGYTGTELTSLEGKWVTFGAFAKLFGITKGLPTTIPRCDMQTAAAEQLPGPHGWTLGKPAKVDGRWAWRVLKKSELKTTFCLHKHTDCTSISINTSTTAYVSDTRKPELLSTSTLGVTEHFYDYNASVTLTAPPADDVLTTIPAPPAGTLPPSIQNGILKAWPVAIQ